MLPPRAAAAAAAAPPGTGRAPHSGEDSSGGGGWTKWRRRKVGNRRDSCLDQVMKKSLLEQEQTKFYDLLRGITKYFQRLTYK